MKNYIFNSKEIGIFEIEGESFEDACDGLEYELSLHGNWAVRPKVENKRAKLYFKGRLFETISCKVE